MSDLKDRLRADLTASIKARDELRSSTLRMVLTAVTNAEVAGKEHRELSDDDVLGVLTSESKKRREAAEAFADAGREAQSQKEQAEAAVIAEYLPEQLSSAEIERLVTETIDELGVREEGMRAMGRVMGVLTPRTKGRADGGALAAVVRAQLGAGSRASRLPEEARPAEEGRQARLAGLSARGLRRGACRGRSCRAWPLPAPGARRASAQG